MKLRTVDPKSIKVPEVRVRARFDDEALKVFQETIKAVGQITPIICYEIGENIVLCDGEHRLQEAIANGESGIKVVILPGDMIDVLTKNIMLDHARGKTPVSDMVVVIRSLTQDYNLDSDQISEKTGIPRAYIEKLWKIAEASPVVQGALDEGWLSVGAAFEISRLPYAIQQEEIVEKQRVYNFKVPDVKDLVDNVLREMKILAEQGPPAVVTEPRPVATYHCEGCKLDVEPRYLRPVMLCPNCFGEVWRLAKARPREEEEKVEETPPS